jgi:hypothetical protein
MQYTVRLDFFDCGSLERLVFLTVPGFELRALSLLGRLSTT